MRLVLMMVSILIISYLIFKGYAAGPANGVEDQNAGKPADALEKAAGVNQLIQDAAEIRRQQLEQQIQQ